ncbi:hypothetical protein TNCV_399761 [Trichonephila clavipes]|nr:hypothetical protein TNCV_399761 [Trichonephila clavipes]
MKRQTSSFCVPLRLRVEHQESSQDISNSRLFHYVLDSSKRSIPSHTFFCSHQIHLCLLVSGSQFE